MVYSYLVLPRGQDAPSTPSHLHRRSRHAKLSDVISSPRASRGGNYNASSSKVEEVPVDNEWDAAHDAATSSSLKTTCLTTATPTPAATATGAKAAANLAGTSPSTKDKDAYINAPLDTVPVDSSPQPGILSPRSQTPPTPDGKDPSPSSSSPAGTGFWRSWKGIAIMVAASSLILGLSLGLGLGLGLPNNHNRDTDTDTGNGGVIDNKRANIVFIMSDDQDKQLNSMDYQSAIQRELVAKGTQFVNHYTNTALCCPSRSTILRGQTVHNTNLTNVQLPG